MPLNALEFASRLSNALKIKYLVEALFVEVARHGGQLLILADQFFV